MFQGKSNDLLIIDATIFNQGWFLNKIFNFETFLVITRKLPLIMRFLRYCKGFFIGYLFVA